MHCARQDVDPFIVEQSYRIRIVPKISREVEHRLIMGAADNSELK